MKFWSMLKAFLPWIGFKVIMDIPIWDTMTMLKLSVVFACCVCIYQTWNKSGKGILHWGTVAFFTVTFAFVVLWPNLWFLKRLGLFSSGTLAVLVWGGIILKHPFTLSYAKEHTDPTLWESPHFIRKNYLISLFWGCVFLVSLGLGALKGNDWDNRVIYDLLDNGMLIAAAAITCVLTRPPR